MQIKTFQALGTKWWIRFFNNTSLNNILFNDILKIIQDFENQFSRFISSSELNQLNKNKYLKNPSKEFLKLINFAQELKELTKSSFDIRVGGILNEIGYDQKYSFQLKNKKYLKKNLLQQLNNKPEIKISKNKIKINKNIQIDLGAFGKGFVIDKISQFLINNQKKFFVINAGGDIFATSNNNKPIKIALEHPFDSKQTIGYIKTKNSAIACSSDNRRKWKNKSINKEFNHLISNSTNNIKAVFTVSKTALKADAASTAIFVSNIKDAEIIAQKLNCEYLIIFKNKKFIKKGKFYLY